MGPAELTPPSLLIRRARPVALFDGDGGRFPGGLVDIVLSEGRIASVTPSGAAASPPGAAPEVDADGRWLLPGLWDAHVHFADWAQVRGRLNVADAAGPAEVAQLVRRQAHQQPVGPIVGFGFRRAGWGADPVGDLLDEACPDRPVVLISGDAHAAWLNSMALALVGVDDVTGLVTENRWFAMWPAVSALIGGDADIDQQLRDAQQAAAARGVVGIGDMEIAAGWQSWPRRVAAGIDRLRVRAAVYPALLDQVIAAGLRTGDALEPSGMAVMGPLKVISDGSLGTLTAFCRHPYPPDPTAAHHPHGVSNVAAADLTALMTRAHRAGLRCAVHAIGDAAADQACAAFAASGAQGSLEHAQLLTGELITALAALPVVASVQPAHLIEDRDLAPRYWPGRDDDVFALRSLLDRGVPLALGSDAPVAPLDPWLAAAVAVYRSSDDRPPWGSGQQITAVEALRASVDGRALRVRDPADVILVDTDPLAGRDAAEAAQLLRGQRVALTVCAGRVTHRDL